MAIIGDGTENGTELQDFFNGGGLEVSIIPLKNVDGKNLFINLQSSQLTSVNKIKNEEKLTKETTITTFNVNKVNSIVDVDSEMKPVIYNNSNKIVSTVNEKFTFKPNIIVCNDYVPPVIHPTNPNPPPVTPPVTPPAKQYLFTGIDPATGKNANWYDTNINSKGPNGQIYLSVGLVDASETSL
jgi:hypothetical protein